jgi:hypothetical protein
MKNPDELENARGQSAIHASREGIGDRVTRSADNACPGELTA